VTFFNRISGIPAALRLSAEGQNLAEAVEELG
jgi:hypothetical protein